LDCSASFAWTITTAIFLHELAHEVADIFVLLAQGFEVWEVAIYNFFSGAIAILGTVVVFASDVSENFQGLLLCFGAGTFLAVALIEILPEVEVLLSKGKQYGSFIPFLFGMTIMGVLLLNHEHCAGGDGHDHAH